MQKNYISQMRKLSLFSCYFLTFSTLFSQNVFTGFGARNTALVGASINDDLYSIFNAIGALGRVESHRVFFGYQNRFGLREFQVIGAGGTLHHDLGNVGLSFSRFGDEVFNMQRMSFAIGNTIEIVSLGLGIDWIQSRVSSIGSIGTLAIQFGGTAKVSDQLTFGAKVFNLNQASLIKEAGENLPTVFSTGFSFTSTNELTINLEIEKELHFDEVFRVGIEYSIIGPVKIRTGISSNPFVSAFGIGVQPKKYKLDYAFTNHSDLGNIHELSIAHSFAR